MWFKTAQSNNEICTSLKDKIKSSSVYALLCKKFKLNPNAIDNLDIKFVDLKENYGLTDAHVMELSPNLLDGSEGELDVVLFHEIYHFICRTANVPERKTDKRGFFHDEEEMEGFSISIAYLLSTGKDLNQITKLVFPKIEFHFHEKEDAIELFKKLISSAKKFLQS